MRLTPDATIHWQPVMDDGIGLQDTQCLYAMRHPSTRKVLYIGKADDSTVSQRLRCRSKLRVWESLDDYDLEGCSLLVGYVALPPGGRLSRELLSDIESLLIMGEQPPGNRQCKASRIERPTLCVRCAGKWSGRSEYYVDGNS